MWVKGNVEKKEEEEEWNATECFPDSGKCTLSFYPMNAS